MSMNIFRLCGDMCHVTSITILLRRLLVARNSQGISLRTQELWLLVFFTRYTDLLTTFYSWYNSVLKIVYLSCTMGIVYVIRFKEPICSTYDRAQDTFPHFKAVILPCLLLATVTFSMSWGWRTLDTLHSLQEIMWTFSIYLEAVAILPQLALLRRYSMVENLTANYVLFRGIYRFFYIINWIYRSYYEPGYQHLYFVYACGVTHVILYIDFFYYWVKSKKEGKELRYGDEGRTEYVCDVNELRNYDNSTSLIDRSNIRMRGKTGAPGEEAYDILVI